MVRVGVLAAVLLGLYACGTSPDVSVALYQTRSDTPVDKIEIQVRNNDARVIGVDRAELRSGQLLSAAVWDEQVDIPPGAALDLKVQLPDVDCSGEAGHQVDLTIDGVHVVLPADDTLGQLRKYLDTRCFAQAVEQAAVVRIEGVTRDGLRVLTRPGTTTIGAMGTTILFAPVDPLAIAASPGGPEQVREVVLRPNRCDAHALGEDKQGTYFPVEVILADGRAGTYTLGVDPRLRGQLYRLYARRCGLS